MAKLNRDLGIAAVHTPPAARDAITDVIAGTAAGHTTYVAGVAGFDFPIWYGIWAPAQTPAGIVSALARDIADTLAAAELSKWLTQHDADPHAHEPPAEFGAFVVSEAERAAVLLATS